ncbi:TatD family hydrolase [Defluviitalea raffinosedens]|uniref:YchF/TatD family DNA exonuclease n=1 Tax=Defluviitalea raffinosedens TaxID=1450156 RepID=A0A7C8HD35_9FIRM|nr:TatD family hydrolase [Defluviitalea raffinosedens]KAE9628755.1 YchF/TatD family DNA exonuclease [Defluviitalea raffinosedens]MBM7686841.1 TatD DNase family protein [Defluviitalea raffinosedens]
MYFESHAHYDDEAFNEDRDELLLSLKDSGIGYVIQSAANISSSKAGIELAKKYDFIYCAIGVHPHDTEELDEEKFKELKSLAAEEKVVAIGEIGLDYYYDNAPRDLQKYWFERQMELSKEVNLPVIIHSREASQDTFDLIEKVKPVGGVIHCYSGSVEMAKEYVKKGFYIGVGGTVTFKNAKKVVEVVKEIPLSSILIETDAPYLSPVPLRGKRNDSRNLKYVVEKIAEIKDITSEEVARITMENGKKLFKI